MPGSPDINELQVLDDARRTRILLERQLAKRIKQLIDGLVDDYRGNKFKPDKALGAVAEIAGMKEQIDTLTRTIRGVG